MKRLSASDHLCARSALEKFDRQRAGARLGYPDIFDVSWGTRFSYPDAGVVIDAIHNRGTYLDVIDNEVPAKFVVRTPHKTLGETRRFSDAMKIAKQSHGFAGTRKRRF